MPRITRSKLLSDEGRISFIPERKYADKYIHRDINGVKDFDLFDWAMETGTNGLLEGPTGPGKTLAVRAWAAARGRYFYRVPSTAGIDPTQVFGKLMPNMHRKADTDPAYVWVDGGAADILRHGGVLLIDEINFTPERISSMLFPVLDEDRAIVLLDHHGEILRAHRSDCWCDLPKKECESHWVLIMATMNPNYSGTRPMNKALRNRFPLQIDWGYDTAVEAALVPFAELRRHVANMRANSRISTPVSTNMMQEFIAAALKFGLAFAVASFVMHFDAVERPIVKGVLDAARVELQDEIDAITSDEDAEALANDDDDPLDDAPDPDGAATDEDDAEEFDWAKGK